MHAINECDDLLIENETESQKFVSSDLHDTIPDTKLTRSLIHKCAVPRNKKDFSFSCKFLKISLCYSFIIRQARE